MNGPYRAIDETANGRGWVVVGPQYTCNSMITKEKAEAEASLLNAAYVAGLEDAAQFVQQAGERHYRSGGDNATATLLHNVATGIRLMVNPIRVQLTKGTP